MSLLLLLDEDTQAKHLVNLLKSAGHNILTVNEAAITGFPDDRVLEYARHLDRILLTRNCDDFQNLHQALSIAINNARMQTRRQLGQLASNFHSPSCRVSFNF